MWHFKRTKAKEAFTTCAKLLLGLLNKASKNIMYHVANSAVISVLCARSRPDVNLKAWEPRHFHKNFNVIYDSLAALI